MTNLKSKSIIFLKRDSFDYYDEDKANIFRLNFTATTVADLEVLSQEELNQQVKTFIDTHKISPSNLIIVLSESLYFKKDFPNPHLNQNTEEVQQFIDYVPFENVSVKVLHVDKISQVVVVNKNLYLSLKDSFENAGFYVSGVFLATIFFGKDTTSVNAIDVQTAKYILSKTDSFRHENLMEMEGQREEGMSLKETQVNDFSEKKKLSPLPVIIIVFILLILILVVFYLKI